MAITLIDVSDKCVPLQAGPGELCINLPGGANICAGDLESGDAAQIVKGLLAQLNTAIAPLTPFFDILEFIQAIFEFATAVPKSILTLNPQPLVEALVDVGKAVDKIVKLIPQLSVPLMILSSVEVIITGLIGIGLKMQAMIKHSQRIELARAAATGNAQLQIIVDCATDNLEIQMANINASFAPLNRLIGLLNILLELAGLPCIPGAGTIPSIDEDGIAALQTTIDVLQAVKAAIPSGPLSLPGLPAAGECP